MSPTSLKDRVVVVTGASRGVGAAVAVACARAGAKLVLAAKTVDPDPRLPGTLLDTKRRVEEAGSEALVVQFDARDATQCEGVIDAAVARFGRIDVLVNNAGAIFWAPVGPTKLPVTTVPVVMSPLAGFRTRTFWKLPLPST